MIGQHFQQLDTQRRIFSSQQSQFNKNYQYGFNPISRRILFTHDLCHLLQVKDRLKQLDTLNNQQRLQSKDIPNITKQDDSVLLGTTFSSVLNSIIKQKQQKNSTTSVQISKNDISLALFRVLKSNFIMTVSYFMVECLSRIAFSFLLFKLFGYVNNGQYGNAYLYASIAGLVLYIGITSRHNGFEQSTIITSRIKSAIIFGVFNKLSKLSQYTVKTTEIGKVINLLSNDFNTLQTKGPIFMIGFTVPVGMIGVIILLVTRIGWTGVICFIVPLLILPIQILVSKFNGKVQERVNPDKDSRIKITTQVIEGIKFVKLYGWEMAFKKVIQGLRSKQISNLMIAGIGRSLERALGNCSALIGAYTCFVITYYNNKEALNTVVILSVLEVMVYFRFLVFFLGIFIGFFYEIKITFQRAATVFNIKNMQMIKIGEFSKKPNNSYKPYNQSQQNFNVDIKVQQINYNQQYPINIGQIRLYNFNGYWNVKNLQVPSLKGLNLFFEKETLYGIGGKVGSGKSGLLGALLGQIPYYSGLMQVSGSISYVEQQPIIFSNTIRQNILFGKEMNESDYNATLDASCLKSDLKILENGDMTIVGERGMTLSGGQKARLCLARALYADSDIYLLDDPLSAVDSKVAKVIFETAIKTLLKFKTVILVTHQINYLEQCDKVLILTNGEAKKIDTPQNMKDQLLQLMTEVKQQQEQKEYHQQQQDLQFQINKIVMNKKGNKVFPQITSQNEMINRDNSEKSKQQSQNNIKISSQKKQSQVKVQLKSYAKYIFFSKINYIIFPITVACFLCAQGCSMTYYRFISTYDRQFKGQNATFKDMNQFWMVLGLLLFGYILFSFLKYALLYTSNLYSNQKIHQDMIHATVRSPSYFFDITPSGQLISKFSNDIGILDNILSFTLIDNIEGPIITAILFANIFQINYYFIIVGSIGLIVFVCLFMYCKRAIIEAKQLDLRLKSPMFNQLSQMIIGIIPINIYKRHQHFLKDFSKKINNSSKGFLSFNLLSRVFGVYLGMCSILVVLIGFLIGISNTNPSTSNLYMVSIIFLIQVNDYLQWFMRQIINMESIMVSVQRAFQITQLKSEAQLYTQYDNQLGIQQEQQQKVIQNQIIPKWPKKPNFKIRNMTMKYREQLPLVLKGLNFDIEQYQKVGIVGRTGAGKSSIVQALLRISEPSQQSTYQIDGCNVLKMGLSSLRHNISVIPQTPFLFKGSIKLNLDPFETKTDSQLWNVLQEAGLKDYVEKLPKQLDTDVSNTSEVFSVGQKQLLCLARALVRNSKILFLDEATSNVDMKTDEFIQNVLKSKFTNTTIIAIAHRLNTIADYDKVIVLSRGRVKQSGSPHELIQKRGLFYEMVSHTGNNAENIIKIAKQTYQKNFRKLRKKSNDL